MKAEDKERYEEAFATFGNEVFAMLAPAPWFPKLEAQLVAKEFKTPSFTKIASVQALADACLARVVLGRGTDVCDAAWLMKDYPFTGDFTLHEGAFRIQCTGYRFMTLAGDARASELRRYLTKHRTGQLGEPTLTRPLLGRVRDGSGLVYPYQPTPPGRMPEPPRFKLARVHVEIAELHVMWALNDGQGRWSRPDIERELATNIDYALGLPGMS